MLRRCAAPAVFFTPLLLMGACAPAGLGPRASDAQVQDAGSGADAATSSEALVDAGRLATDAGLPEQDAGHPGEDAGARPAGDGGTLDAGPSFPLVPLPAVPLHTQSRWIVDRTGKRFKLASVSWFGAESPDFVVGGLDRVALPVLAHQIRALGFNSVRLPYSNQLVETNPLVERALLAANDGLQGLRALDLMDRVIEALAHEGLVVILDNHVSRADWCCDGNDGNGLWYSADYSEAAWLRDWETIAERYRGTPAVVGAELRNELRASGGVEPTWGTGIAATDWKRAAEKGAEAVLRHAPDWLIIVQGLSYSQFFNDMYSKPAQLGTPNRLVYAPHDYNWFHSGAEDFDHLRTALGNQWGFLLAQEMPYTAPVWVSEFGTCSTEAACVASSTGGGLWFQSFLRYLREADIDWAYWPLNGTQSTGTGRTRGAQEIYGVLDIRWSAPASAELLEALRGVSQATQGP